MSFHEKCPHYIPPKYCVNPDTDEDFEGTASCDLSDSACIVEYGGVACETLESYYKELVSLWD